MPKVIVYSTPNCVFCKMAKSYFQANNVAFEEKDVSVDIPAQKRMIDISGQMGVPVIEVDDKIIIGFDKAKLAQLLKL